MAGTVLTNKGLSLITKLVSSQATLSFSRVAVGTGHTPSGYDPQSMIGLNEHKMDAAISSYGVSPDREDVAYLVAQVSSVDVPVGFAITEAGVFATDPDEGEILYAYLDLTEDPQYIYASTDAISKFAEITFNVIIGSVESVTAIVSPGALVTKKEYDALEKRTADLEIPDLDIPEDGGVEGISSFPDFLSTMVSKIPLIQLLKNMYAGFQFVLHAGELVNNCTSTAANLPLAAAQGKVLMDMVTKLNSETQISRRDLVNGDDLNDLITNGMWWFNSTVARYIKNSAYTAASVIVVFRTGWNYAIQLQMTDSGFAYRFRTLDGVWETWTKL